MIATKASQALHVLDRFHIASHMNKAIDQVRAQEARELQVWGILVFDPYHATLIRKQLQAK